MLYALLLALAAVPPPADLMAVGVIVSLHPERSVALLRAGGRTRVAAVGETAFGGRVVAISAGAVSVEFAASRVELRLPSAGGALAAAPPPPREVPGATVLARRDVERRLGDEAPRILAETTLVPAMDGGRVAGFALSRLPEGTLLTDAGLKAGDIVTEINGVPIDSMATLISLWPRLQNESSLRAVVIRNGQPVTLTVSLR